MKCALCLQNKRLLRSHVIPNAVFRRIKQSAQVSQLVTFDTGTTSSISKTQNSWFERLLCENCEKVIGKYEKYGIEVLRNINKGDQISRKVGVLFQGLNYEQFKLFLTSIIWRAAVSKQNEFQKVIIPHSYLDNARRSLLHTRPLSELSLGCKLLLMVDETGGLSDENMREIVISPIPRLPKNDFRYSFLFIFEGLIFEFFIPNIPSKRRNDLGVIKKTNNLYVPTQSWFKIPELMNLLQAGVIKDSAQANGISQP